MKEETSASCWKDKEDEGERWDSCPGWELLLPKRPLHFGGVSGDEELLVRGGLGVGLEIGGLEAGHQEQTSPHRPALTAASLKCPESQPAKRGCRGCRADDKPLSWGCLATPHDSRVSGGGGVTDVERQCGGPWSAAQGSVGFKATAVTCRPSPTFPGSSTKPIPGPEDLLSLGCAG